MIRGGEVINKWGDRVFNAKQPRPALGVPMFTEISRAAAFIITFKCIRHSKKKRARKTLVDILNALIDDC